MVTIGTHLYHYANCDKAGVTHGSRRLRGRMRAKENKNLTKVQDFLSEHWDILQSSLKGKED